MTQLSRECIIHAAADILQTYGPVSYTHLTLPTKA